MIETRISTIYMTPEGILVIRQKDNVLVEKEDFEASMDYYRSFFRGHKFPNLLLLGNFTEFDQEVMEFNAPIHQNHLFSAQAIVLKALPHRLAVNYYLKKFPSTYPRKVFSTEEEAMRWLEQFL